MVGGWELFQRLLSTLGEIAQKHHVSISNVAVRAILDRPTVAGVIIGVRLGITEHRAVNARVFDFALDPEDYARNRCCPVSSPRSVQSNRRLRR